MTEVIGIAAAAGPRPRQRGDDRQPERPSHRAGRVAQDLPGASHILLRRVHLPHRQAQNVSANRAPRATGTPAPPALTRCSSASLSARRWRKQTTEK